MSRATWLRTNGVNTNGAAAKVMNLPGLGESWHFGKIHLTGVPKSTSVKKHGICSDPSSVDPICPLPSLCLVLLSVVSLLLVVVVEVVVVVVQLYYCCLCLSLASLFHLHHRHDDDVLGALM